MCTHRLCALDLWWLVRVVVVNLEREVERATLVHAYAPGHQDLIIGERETIQNTPSSGQMVRVKFSRSVGSGKCVVIVEGRSSSVRSRVPRRDQWRTLQRRDSNNTTSLTRTFLHTNLGRASLGLLLGCLILVLLHTPYLTRQGISAA